MANPFTKESGVITLSGSKGIKMSVTLSLMSFLISYSHFDFQIPIIESEAKAGLRLRPAQVDVNLVNKPLTDVKFEQFLATVFGDIHCISKLSLLFSINLYSLPILCFKNKSRVNMDKSKLN